MFYKAVSTQDTKLQFINHFEVNSVRKTVDLLGTEEQRRTRDPQVRMARKIYRDKTEHKEPTRNAVICQRPNLVGIYCVAAANLFKIDVLNEGALNEIGEILL